VGFASALDAICRDAVLEGRKATGRRAQRTLASEAK
jgi:hypothetical protein